MQSLPEIDEFASSQGTSPGKEVKVIPPITHLSRCRRRDATERNREELFDMGHRPQGFRDIARKPLIGGKIKV